MGLSALHFCAAAPEVISDSNTIMLIVSVSVNDNFLPRFAFCARLVSLGWLSSNSLIPGVLSKSAGTVSGWAAATFTLCSVGLCDLVSRTVTALTCSSGGCCNISCAYCSGVKLSRSKNCVVNSSMAFMDGGQLACSCLASELLHGGSWLFISFTCGPL